MSQLNSQKNEPKVPESWASRNKGTLGIIAILIFCIVLKLVSGTRKSSFHEIIWDDKKIAADVASDLYIKRKLDAFVNRKATADFATGNYTTSKSLDTLKIRYSKAYYRVLAGIIDSTKSLTEEEWKKNFPALITIVPPSNYLIDHLPDAAGSLPVNIIFKSPRIPGYSYQYPTSLPFKKNVHSNTLIVKHPSLGLWLLLIIIQCALYISLIFWLAVRFKDAKPDLTAKPYLIHWPDIQKCIWLSVLTCLVFYIALLVNNNVMIKPQYFMHSIRWVLGATNILGYASAGLCLAGFIVTNSMITHASKDEELNRQDDKTAATDIANIVNVQPPAPANTAAPASVLTKYRTKIYWQIFENFDLNFILLSLILTLGTITTSSFFTGLSSLPIIKEIARAQGYPVFPQEVVYLYGIVHSALVLVPYLLIKKKLKTLATSWDITFADTTKMSSFSKGIMDVLVTGGPLLATALKSLFENL